MEIAGELAEEFEGKTVTLAASRSAVLPGMREDIVLSVERILNDLGVVIRRNSRIKSVENHDADGSRADVTFEDGGKVATDVYIDATGLTPNSDYISPEYLTEKGFLRVDEHLRVPGVDDVYGLGDIIDSPVKTIREIWIQLPAIRDAILADLGGTHGRRLTSYKAKPDHLVGIYIGKRAGIAVAWGWKIPDIVVKFLLTLTSNMIVKQFSAVKSGWRF